MTSDFDNQPDLNEDPFDEYYRHGNPTQKELAGAWQAAIGLQDVDGLRTSKYLVDTALQTIEGEISLDKAHRLIESYYKENPSRATDRAEEADKVATRITQLLSEPGFSFSVAQYLSIHRRLFTGISPHAGKVRDYNISKKEWVLDGASVTYANAYDALSILEYDVQSEKEFDASHLTIDQYIEHLCQFVARLWQVHPFGEGNTRTTAVFFIKYLQTGGFEVNNAPFAENAWFFRNALVRANYENITAGIRATNEYLNMFFRNVLLGETNELRNRQLHIHWRQQHAQKQDIGPEKQDIQTQKQDIHAAALSSVNRSHAQKLFEAFGFTTVFSRKDVIETIDITASPASTLIAKLTKAGILETVKGQGKGKLRFSIKP